MISRQSIILALQWTLTAVLCYCVVFVKFDTSQSSSSSDVEDASKPNFVGQELWLKRHQMLCDDPEEDKRWMLRESLCYTKRHGFELTNIEVLSFSPPVIIYRELFSRNQVNAYLEIFRKQKLKEEKVVGANGQSVISKGRRANGTVTSKWDFPEVNAIVKTASRLVPFINFNNAENILGLSYLSGGHYAVHSDFLKNTKNSFTQSAGNRMATFLMIFKIADIGGATMFSDLHTTARTGAGDAVFWFNMRMNKEKEMLTRHAGCPVYQGEKIVATIWLRSEKQPAFGRSSQNKSFDARFLLRETDWDVSFLNMCRK